MAGCVAVLLAGALMESGCFQRSSLAATDTPIRASLSAGDPRCAQIAQLMARAGWRIDRTDPASPKIVGQGADQIPAEAAQIVINCDAAGSNDGGAPPPPTAGPAQ